LNSCGTAAWQPQEVVTDWPRWEGTQDVVRFPLFDGRLRLVRDEDVHNSPALCDGAVERGGRDDHVDDPEEPDEKLSRLLRGYLVGNLGIITVSDDN